MTLSEVSQQLHNEISDKYRLGAVSIAMGCESGTSCLYIYVLKRGIINELRKKYDQQVFHGFKIKSIKYVGRSTTM